MNILHIDPNNTNINIDNLYSYNIHSACLIVYINYTFFTFCTSFVDLRIALC